jgi:hypothetical protein
METNPVEISFDTYEDSKSKIALYLESFNYLPVEVHKANIIDRVLEMNKQLNPQVRLDEVVDLYNTIIIYGRSYTKLLDEKEGVVQAALSFSELMSQEFPKARYVIEPFFESGTVNMVSAPPNTWKSWLLFYFSAHITQGTQPFNKFEVEQSKVMIVNEEDSFRAIQDRFKILDITDTTLPIYFRVANGAKLESKFIDVLLAELKEKDIKVVIFDSLRSMHEADENDSTAMQKILDQMKRISREGITVIFTHHHRKKGMFEKHSSSESSRGSSAINAAISGHISLEEEDRDSGLYLVIRHLKSKAGEKLDPFEIKIVKEGGKVQFVYEGEFKDGEKKMNAAKDQIMSILADGKWKPVKDFEGIDAGKTIMRQALTVLKNEGAIVAVSRKQAIQKLIPVTPKGNAREFYYAVNNEITGELAMTENDIANKEFNDM